MYQATADDRGTVQALARQLDKAQEDGGFDFQLSPKFSLGAVAPAIFHLTLRNLQLHLLHMNLRSSIALPTTDAPSLPLFKKMKRFPYVIISNRRYLAAEHAKSPSDSYFMVRTHAIPGSSTWVGELREIFAVDQPQVGIHYYGFIRWFVPVEPSVSSGSVWANL
ncbi:hypothetical protein K438DRAFT_1788226 [Mycena galopus ATCC 62051]|nr:hypothetical protein K438DRAFT_1788226 [Mycena galopus ATCC 62051]